VDGKALTDERRFCGRRSRVVLAPQCPASSSCEAEQLRRSDGGKRNGSPRRAPISRKPSRREGRSVSAWTCGQRASRNSFLRGDPGACGHPAFPAPSHFKEGDGDAKARANAAARVWTCVCSQSLRTKRPHPPSFRAAAEEPFLRRQTPRGRASGIAATAPRSLDTGSSGQAGQVRHSDALLALRLPAIVV
jgi:hypothetical protein